VGKFHGFTYVEPDQDKLAREMGKLQVSQDAGSLSPRSVQELDKGYMDKLSTER
jgi:hypothetical protein